MLNPADRPSLSLVPLVALLAAHDVDWVMTGSGVLAAHGADLVPQDLDVTPALEPANLERLAATLAEAAAIPAYTPGWRDDFTEETCRSWRPYPAVEENLEWLYVTRFGMLDVPLRMCGTYDELRPRATTVDIGGVPVLMCDPAEVLARVTVLRSPKHLARTAVYQSFAAQLNG